MKKIIKIPVETAFINAETRGLTQRKLWLRIQYIYLYVETLFCIKNNKIFNDESYNKIFFKIFLGGSF